MRSSRANSGRFPVTIDGVVISLDGGAIMITAGSESTRTGAPAWAGVGAGCTFVDRAHAPSASASIGTAVESFTSISFI